MNHHKWIFNVISALVVAMLVISPGYSDQGKYLYSVSNSQMHIDTHAKNIHAAIDINKLMSDVEWLADDARMGRGTGTPAEEEVIRWLKKRFSSLSLKPFKKIKLSNFAHDFEFHRYDDAGIEHPAYSKNIVGVIEGSDKGGEYVLVSSHFDHLGVENGSIFNGADDDASGVAAMLEIARVILEQGIKPKKSIVFVAFAAEEIGRHGSWNFCHAIYEGKVSNKMVALNLEMLGPASHSSPYVHVWEQDRYSTQPIIHALRLASEEVKVGMITTASLDPGSDALELLECGVAATTMDMSGGEQFEMHHPYYHTPEDKAENIDQRAYLKAVQVAAIATWLLANDLPK